MELFITDVLFSMQRPDMTINFRASKSWLLHKHLKGLQNNFYNNVWMHRVCRVVGRASFWQALVIWGQFYSGHCKSCNLLLGFRHLHHYRLQQCSSLHFHVHLPILFRMEECCHSISNVIGFPHDIHREYLKHAALLSCFLLVVLTVYILIKLCTCKK